MRLIQRRIRILEDTPSTCRDVQISDDDESGDEDASRSARLSCKLGNREHTLNTPDSTHFDSFTVLQMCDAQGEAALLDSASHKLLIAVCITSRRRITDARSKGSSVPVRDESGKFVGVRPQTAAERRQVRPTLTDQNAYNASRSQMYSSIFASKDSWDQPHAIDTERDHQAARCTKSFCHTLLHSSETALLPRLLSISSRAELLREQ